MFYPWNHTYVMIWDWLQFFGTSQFPRDPSKLLQVSVVHSFPQLVSPFILWRTSGLIPVSDPYNICNVLVLQLGGIWVFTVLLILFFDAKEIHIWKEGREGRRKRYCLSSFGHKSARLWVTTEAKAGLVFRKQEPGTRQHQGPKPHMGSRKPVQDLQPLRQVSEESHPWSQRSFSRLCVCGWSAPKWENCRDSRRNGGSTQGGRMKSGNSWDPWENSRSAANWLREPCWSRGSQLEGNRKRWELPFNLRSKLLGIFFPVGG